jgi:hypothetical protein
MARVIITKKLGWGHGGAVIFIWKGNTDRFWSGNNSTGERVLHPQPKLIKRHLSITVTKRSAVPECRHFG